MVESRRRRVPGQPLALRRDGLSCCVVVTCFGGLLRFAVVAACRAASSAEADVLAQERFELSAAEAVGYQRAPRELAT